MFDRYTEAGRRSLFFARDEAARAGSPFIETEHFLLGLLRADTALAARILQGTDLEAMRREVLGTASTATSPPVDLPLSHPMKRVLAYAAEEAERLQRQHRRLDSGHLLLGLLREPDTGALLVLQKHGIDLK